MTIERFAPRMYELLRAALLPLENHEEWAREAFSSDYWRWHGQVFRLLFEIRYGRQPKSYDDHVPHGTQEPCPACYQLKQGMELRATLPAVDR